MKGCEAMKISTGLGDISIAQEVFTTISGYTATKCFGVRGMAARSVSDGLVHLLRPDSLAKGVKVRFSEDGAVNIELHIVTEHGVNIPVVCRSIIEEVRYNVEKLTQTRVGHVDVCIDSISTEG